MAQNSNISVRSLGSNAHFSTRHHAITRGVARKRATTNMAARGLLRKTLLPPNLVNCLRYCLFLSSKTSILQAISTEKKRSFKSLCWNVNENVDAAFDQSKKQQEKSTPLRSFYQASLTFGYLWHSSSTTYVANNNSKKENTIGGYLRLFVWNCGLY